jgi:hypothetical protein
MPIDRDLVDKFLLDVDRSLLPYIRAGSAKLYGYQKLIAKFEEERAAWCDGKVDHIREITSFVNEMVFAKLMLDDSNVSEARYESGLDGTDKTIDFVVTLVGSEAHIHFDLKTVQPTINDAWDRYEKFTSKSWFTPGTELVLNKELLGGEIAHDLFAPRQHFLDYTLELESKIRAMPEEKGNCFRLVFCGDGIRWRRDLLEDFADFYFSGQYRPDDPLGLMQSHNMAESKRTFDRSIQGFCYLGRKIRSLEPDFRVDVRGPAFPWSNPQIKRENQ